MDDQQKEDLPLEKALRTLLDRRRTQSTLRNLTLNPHQKIDFSSNDFLSLSNSPLLRSTFLSELSRDASFPLGSGGSRLLDGNSAYAEDLEKEIAAFHGAEAGLLFNSGFDANAGFFACVPQKGDVVVFDELIHASVHDGMRLSRAVKKVRFKHNDVRDLRRVLERTLREVEGVIEGRNHVIVAVEAVYSMDGDLAPLKEIVEVVERSLPRGGGYVVVDEAHATGVIGPEGRGLVNVLGLEKRVFARLHTFGKALACNGAIILGSPLLRHYLINYARPLIYTTFMSFPTLAAIRASYRLLQEGQTVQMAQHLNSLVSFLYTELRSRPSLVQSSTLQIPKEKPQSPIFAILASNPRSLASFLQGRGMMVRAVVPPTVPEGTSRIRVCLHAGNTVEEVRVLVDSIEEWVMQSRRVGKAGALETGVGFSAKSRL
ncbi:PLP-dependent transferase [Westerdykella ornata]|uniref:PLP-dependent transferase n=1 Tax=Westerdykella ornata TaxID=318751 RepID=A0A6A6J995_WESOR|nr:PLP-dependent transferase [Westerdykella ornata]KAF2272972.1 PLP-dependent transferase [Westerdykella ornata]